MVSVTILSVVMLNVIMLIVVAPHNTQHNDTQLNISAVFNSFTINQRVAMPIVIMLNVVRLSVVAPVLCLGIITKIIFSQAANLKHILQVLFILCRNKLVRLKSTEAKSATKRGSCLNLYQTL